MDFQGEILHERYAIGPELGAGGAATVYRADDLRLGRVVAIKLLRPELRSDPAFVARFEREARSIASLEHPHIVPVYDYGEGLGTHFLVMQYVPGGTLRARVRRDGPLSIAAAVRIGAEVGEALGAAHAKGIVHRDVKSANILLMEDDGAKVTDFGIAKMLDVPSLTASATLLGTPHYLAPEQASGGAITPATDVYSLGIVLFEMLTGQRPYEGDSFVWIAMQHVCATPPALAERNPAVPPELAALVVRALAKDPQERFADGAAIARALRALERTLGVPRDVSTEELASEPGTASPRPLAATARAITHDPGSGPGSFASRAATIASVAVPDWRPMRPETPHSAQDRAPSLVTPPTGPTDPAEDTSVAAEGTPPDGAGAELEIGPEQPRAVDSTLDSARPYFPRRRTSFVPIVVVLGLGLLAAALVARGLGAAVAPAPVEQVAGRGVQSPVEPAAPPADDLAPAADEAAPEAAPGPAPSEAPAPTAVPTAAPTQAPAVAPSSAPSVVPTEAPAAAAPPAAPVSGSGRVVLDDDAFTGGYSSPRDYRGRTARWIYGALGEYGQMSASFTVQGTPDAGQLVLQGLDSENGPKTPLAVLINDTVVYQGGNPLPKDNWRGPVAPWGEATIPIPRGVLHAGRNTLTLKNQAPAANFNAPPYIVLDQAIVTY